MVEVLPDVLDHGLVIVFCGTAASNVSARAGAYYANRGNAFWRALHETRMTPRLFAPGEFRELLQLQIGLTDLAKYTSGNDNSLKRRDFGTERLHESIRRFQPRILAFTSKTAWRAWRGLPARSAVAYGWQGDKVGATRLFVLPSPSGAARGYWDLAPWQELADAYRLQLNMTEQNDARLPQ